MTHTWKTFGLATAIAVAGVAGHVGPVATVAAQPRAENAQQCKTIVEAMERWQKQLTETNEKLPDTRLEEQLLIQAVARLQAGALNRDAFARAMATTAGRDAVPKDLREWIAKLDPSQPSVAIDTVRLRLAAVTSTRQQMDQTISLGEPQLQQARRQAAALGCDMKSIDLGAADASAGGGSVNSTNSTSGTTSTTSVGGGSATTKPVTIAAGPADWAGDWVDDYGTISFVPNSDRSIADELQADSTLMGPALTCDRTAVFMGQFEWARTPKGFGAAWKGRVIACTNGAFLEGRLTNSGEKGVRDPDLAVKFRIAMADATKKSFKGSYAPFTPPRLGAEVPWTGKRE
jgi:hypothetical protein